MKVSISYNGLSKRYYVRAADIERYSVREFVRRRTCELNDVIAEKKVAYDARMRRLEGDLASARRIVRLGREGSHGHCHTLDRSAELEILVCELEQKRCSERMAFWNDVFRLALQLKLELRALGNG